jgi:hypothetical protein
MVRNCKLFLSDHKLPCGAYAALGDKLKFSYSLRIAPPLAMSTIVAKHVLLLHLCLMFTYITRRLAERCRRNGHSLMNNTRQSSWTKSASATFLPSLWDPGASVKACLWKLRKKLDVLSNTFDAVSTQVDDEDVFGLVQQGPRSGNMESAIASIAGDLLVSGMLCNRSNEVFVCLVPTFRLSLLVSPSQMLCCEQFPPPPRVTATCGCRSPQVFFCNLAE